MTNSELSTEEFFKLLWAETEISPTVTSEEVAAAQSYHARRNRRDIIIAERGRLYKASKLLYLDEMIKIRPSSTENLDEYVARRNLREKYLEEMRTHWWKQIDEMWSIPPTEFEKVVRNPWFWYPTVTWAISLIMIAFIYNR